MNMRSQKICREHGFECSSMFNFKTEIYYYEAKTIFWMFLVSVIIQSYILRIFELPYDEDPHRDSNSFNDYGTAIYLTIITFTSVGYGDFHAHTVFGQITSMIIAFWGTFVMSLIIMVVSNIFEFNPEEKKAVFFIK